MIQQGSRGEAREKKMMKKGKAKKRTATEQEEFGNQLTDVDKWKQSPFQHSHFTVTIF
jgi:hypothetical protein